MIVSAARLGLPLAALLLAVSTGTAAPALAAAAGGESATEAVPSKDWPFDGLLQVLSVNDPGKCNGNGTGDEFRSVYRPVYDGTDSHPAAITVIGHRSAFLLYDKAGTNKTLNGSGTYGRDAIWSRGYSASTPSAGTYTLTVKPNTSSANTATTVLITGTITNWWSNTGCTATIRGVYQRRED